MADEIIGAYFFENDMGNAVTVYGERYRIYRYFPWISTWSKTFGHTSHKSHRERNNNSLNRLFPQKLISRHGDVNCPPRSPDLTIPDFFLWGYINEKVYINKPNTISQLKRNIQEEIRQINGNTLTKATENVEKRLEMCCRENGRHLTEIVFHKCVQV